MNLGQEEESEELMDFTLGGLCYANLENCGVIQLLTASIPI